MNGFKGIFGGIAAIAALSVFGCEAGFDTDLSGGGDTGTDSYNGPVVGRIKGVVTLPDGSPIEGVTVTLRGTELTGETDASGYYEIVDVAPGDAILRFTKRGYTSNMRDTEVLGWETRSINARLLEADAVRILSTAAGGRIQTDELKIDFPAGGFVSKADGTPLAGEVEISVTHIDPTTDEIWAAPNDFTALAGPNVTTVGLMSYAMVDVQMNVDGEEAELADGTSAIVELVIPDTLPDLQHLELGDTIPTWHFDEDLATWVHEGETTVVPSTTDPGRMAGVIDAPYFSAWNLDDCWTATDLNGNAVTICAQAPITCVVGTVKDVGNNPVIGADVYAGATNFSGAVSATTDEEGQFILWPVMEGAVIDIRAESIVGMQSFTVTDGSYAVMSPDGTSITAAPTDPSQCMEIPDITLPTCVVGAVVEVDNRRMWDGMNASVIEDATTGKAYFFEPDGTPETCSNIEPVDLPEDECEIIPTEDEMLDFFWGQEPLDAGMDVRVAAGNDELELELTERLPGDFFYERATAEYPLPFETRMDIRAEGKQGNVHQGIPAVDLPEGLPMGREIRTTAPAIDEFFAFDRSQGLSLRTEYADPDAWGNIAMIVPEDTSNGICLCRFADDGAFDVPAEITSQLPSGPAAILISRIKTDMRKLPNGYWARTLGRASATMIGEINE
jgi:hypothetical protein